MQIGSRIGRYRVLGKIGEGGMGEVYLADDIGLNRKVALKVLSNNVAGDDGKWWCCIVEGNLDQTGFRPRWGP